LLEMTFITRDATRSDAALLAKLGADTFVETFGTLYKPSDLAAFLENTHSLQAVEAQFDRPDIAYRLAQTQAGAPIGFCKIGPLSLPADSQGKAAGELYQLYLFKAYHGLGVADTLMEWALTTLQSHGAQAVYLSVFSQNPRAQRFYRRYGFRHHKDYFFMVGTQADAEYIYEKVF
jgi:ribosomal protein S18 acetylase RimI-like enzyme